MTRSLEKFCELELASLLGTVELARTCRRLLGWDLTTSLGLVTGLVERENAGVRNAGVGNAGAGTATAGKAADTRATERAARLGSARAELVWRAHQHLSGTRRDEFDHAVGLGRRAYSLSGQGAEFALDAPVALTRASVQEAGQRMLWAGSIFTSGDELYLRLDEVVAWLEGDGGAGDDGAVSGVDDRVSDGGDSAGNRVRDGVGDGGRVGDGGGLASRVRRRRGERLWALGHRGVPLVGAAPDNAFAVPRSIRSMAGGARDRADALAFAARHVLGPVSEGSASTDPTSEVSASRSQTRTAQQPGPGPVFADTEPAGIVFAHTVLASTGLPAARPADAGSDDRDRAGVGSASGVPTDRKSAPVTLAGVGASAGTATGTARIVSTESDLERVRAGDVLVCGTIPWRWTSLVPALAGIVTDSGGVLSPAGIFARELELPAVTGTGAATRALVDGQRVTVDGNTGRVIAAG